MVRREDEIRKEKRMGNGKNRKNNLFVFINCDL
jgi:hypothetical protein